MDLTATFFPRHLARPIFCAATLVIVIPSGRCQDPFTARIMADETERDSSDERARAEAETSEHVRAEPKRRKRWGLRIGTAVILVPLLLLSLWTAITLNFSYSAGKRGGYLQKFSRKGWLCKTWEGEIAMANIPGTMPEIFSFTVRDDSVAQEMNKMIGQRVALDYKQHRGVPGTCFGETQYYVNHAEAVAAP